MKLLILSLIVLAVGCDTPTRARFPGTASSNAIGTPNTTGGFSPAPISGTTAGTTGGTTSEPGFESCNLAKNNMIYDPTATCVEKQTNPSAPCPARFGVCKNLQDQTMIRFVSSVTSTQNRTCFIPMYNSEYLGDPQCTYTSAEAVVTGRLYKTRSGYTNYPVTSVVVLTEGLLVEFYACQDAYQKYVNYYCPANPAYCAQAAMNYRSSICNAFTNKYPGYFRQISL